MIYSWGFGLDHHCVTGDTFFFQLLSFSFLLSFPLLSSSPFILSFIHNFLMFKSKLFSCVFYLFFILIELSYFCCFSFGSPIQEVQALCDIHKYNQPSSWPDIDSTVISSSPCNGWPTACYESLNGVNCVENNLTQLLLHFVSLVLLIAS